MAEAHQHVHFGQILADGGYDSEANHQFCRHTLGIRSTVIACNRRGCQGLPTGTYRRQMAQRFAHKAYGNRWQVESVFSRNKRLFGSALRARSAATRKQECYLRVLTHHLMILRRAA
jgi:transposase